MTLCWHQWQHDLCNWQWHYADTSDSMTCVTDNDTADTSDNMTCITDSDTAQCQLCHTNVCTRMTLCWHRWQHDLCNWQWHYADTSDSMTCVTDSDTMLTPVTTHFGPRLTVTQCWQLTSSDGKKKKRSWSEFLKWGSSVCLDIIWLKKKKNAGFIQISNDSDMPCFIFFLTKKKSFV